jgi:hypothetical protein
VRPILIERQRLEVPHHAADLVQGDRGAFGDRVQAGLIGYGFVTLASEDGHAQSE